MSRADWDRDRDIAAEGQRAAAIVGTHYGVGHLLDAATLLALADDVGVCDDDDLRVWSDGFTWDDEPMYAVVRRHGATMSGCWGLTAPQALRLIGVLRRSTAATDRIVRDWLRTEQAGPDLGPRGDL